MVVFTAVILTLTRYSEFLQLKLSKIRRWEQKRPLPFLLIKEKF